MWFLQKATDSTKIGFPSLFLQMLWMMQYSLRGHIQKNYILLRQALKVFFYLTLVNNGILLKVTYGIKF